jgi:16S rRNA (cytosine967-C5)-methyltransferase
MKWYPNIAQAVTEALFTIFVQNKQADKVIVKLLKSNKKWGSRDRKFIAKVLYDIVRWKLLYEYLSGNTLNTETGRWNILAVWAIMNDIPLPDWDIFSQIDKNTILDKYYNLTDEQIKQSVPEWLFNTGIQSLGKKRWIDEIKSLNKEAPVYIRINTLKTNKHNIANIFNRNNIDYEEVTSFPDTMKILSRVKLTQLPAYRKGYFEIQDISSQQVAPFSGVKPGMTVIDACAGAGGKTLHLAAIMKNKGEIFAYDIYSSKIDELKRRALRNGVKNISEAKVITPEIINKNLQKADILLLDAPCSSLGTLRRKPGLKWELNPEKLKQINVIQQNIINDYEKMLKPGGYLIYVTCSILPLENEEIVNSFLKTHKNYTFVVDKTIYPSRYEGDGFYLAKLKKLTT